MTTLAVGRGDNALAAAEPIQHPRMLERLFAEVLGKALLDQLTGEGCGARTGGGIGQLHMKFHVEPPPILACDDFEGVGPPSCQRTDQCRAL
ncbi:hypothetical protein D3C81_1886870 [compost metagenome]